MFCLQVDRPGVVYVKTTSLTRDPAEIAALVSKMSSGRNTPNSPAVSRRLGFHSPPGGPGTPRRSGLSPRSSSTPGGYLPWSSGLTHKPCRVFCVATASSRRVKGGWDVEVSELSPFEIDSVAPVRVENRSGASIAFRQGDTPITSAGDDVVEPGAIVAYTWDDPFGAKKLVVSVPGSEYETTVSIHPDSSADREDSDSIDEEDEEGGSHVTRQMVVRFFDEKRPNALLRLRITRSESASVPCVVTVEEADAQANTAAAASHRGEFLFTFVWAI